MVKCQVFNLHGKVVYELHDDGYEECNTYNSHGKLVKRVKYKNNKLIGVKRPKSKNGSSR